MCHFFLFARVKCKYSLGSNAPSSRLSGSFAQLTSQASRIFLWCQLLLVLRIVASFHAILWLVFITWSASSDFLPCLRPTAFWCSPFLVKNFLCVSPRLRKNLGWEHKFQKSSAETAHRHQTFHQRNWKPYKTSERTNRDSSYRRTKGTAQWSWTAKIMMIK